MPAVAQVARLVERRDAEAVGAGRSTSARATGTMPCP